ncbi:EAL domain-containing protein [Ferrovibrio sp.]|uniref:putative bifunctional diguanylate cyclase/phosphodiesterase n=1 Tax=Ferrovibrio sp. TaxID=1917215 RepID=UPI0025C55C05|nr:EAL domain-containing protein [Ferrovibrio sp.]MBX3453866.1 EAL domain-containing protein [Ferrovibrio sp.]
MKVPISLLLVEDSEDDAELVVMELVRSGYSPSFRRVESAAALRAALEETEWDAVLSDFRLPGFGAEQALAILHESGKDLPFIILSGVVGAEEAVQLLKRGAHDFLNKDSLARLIPALERELREAKERRQRRRAEEELRILSLAVQQSPISVMITDRNGIISYVNPKFEEVSGYRSDEALGQRLDFIRFDQQEENPYQDLWATVRSGVEWRGECCNQRADGQIFWEYITVSPLKNALGAVTHFVAVKEDITVRRSYEEYLRRQAHFDPLTGLPNRMLLLDRVDQAIVQAQRNRGKAAVLCVDLDRFKHVNDTLGHAAGDALLKEAANRLAGCARESDTIARLAGDEFVLLLPGVDGSVGAQRVAQRVVDAFALPFGLEGQEHFVTASIGIALFPDDGVERQLLLRNADLAMYKAKELGRNGYQFFTADINIRMQERLALEARLRNALRRQELHLHFQPIMDLRNGQAIALEALLRWITADGISVPPDQFVPVAEEIGLIREIGDWAARKACELLRDRPEIPRVALNVSPRQLRVAGFADRMGELLAEHGLPAERLELEITESVLMDDASEAEANLRRLNEIGIRLVVDDFGTGYSSLAYLRRYPFKALKIDRSFVNAAPRDANAARLVEAVLAMARGLGLDAVAEGVETAEQLNFLRRRGCEMAQGFLLGRPQPVEKLPATLEAAGRMLRDTL